MEEARIPLLPSARPVPIPVAASGHGPRQVFRLGPRLPAFPLPVAHEGSWSAGLTAAGPLPILTGFPFDAGRFRRPWTRYSRQGAAACQRAWRGVMVSKQGDAGIPPQDMHQTLQHRYGRNAGAAASPCRPRERNAPKRSSSFATGMLPCSLLNGGRHPPHPSDKARLGQRKACVAALGASGSRSEVPVPHDRQDAASACT